jgi:hypothetical protein
LSSLEPQQTHESELGKKVEFSMRLRESLEPEHELEKEFGAIRKRREKV